MIDLNLVCIDRCETAQLQCILNCPADDVDCLSGCIREVTECVNGEVNRRYYKHNIILSMSLRAELS